MSEKILVPVLGESITEATVSKWLKNEGDKVEADEPIVELETDKVNLEVPSPVTGVLSQINSKDGTIVKVGAILGSVTENLDKVNHPSISKSVEMSNDENNIVNLNDSKDEPKILDEKIEEKTLEEKPLVLTNEEKPLVLTNEIKDEKISNNIKENKTLSPAVRKIVTENDLNIDSI